jgi:hypothetical protein
MRYSARVHTIDTAITRLSMSVHEARRDWASIRVNGCNLAGALLKNQLA